MKETKLFEGIKTKISIAWKSFDAKLEKTTDLDGFSHRKFSYTTGQTELLLVRREHESGSMDDGKAFYDQSKGEIAPPMVNIVIWKVKNEDRIIITGKAS